LYDTTSYAEESFGFAAFDYHGKALCIPLKKSVFFETEFILNTIDKNDIIINEDLQTKKNYCKQVKKAISVIKSSNASKIVLSRKKEIDLKQFDISILIKRLLNLYPNAFRYIWYHPQTGFWCGASPEVLLEMERISFATMALAGTQRVKKDAIPYWNFKELNEQKIVVDSIAASLQKVASVIRTSETYNYQAASLVHLRTDITGTLKEGKNTLSMIASILHPTPAVCGTPQDYAKSYILDNEDYNREFYTGFLGPMCEKDSCSKLFVNLRCMKIDANSATLFVGGGITIDSEPESEWEETQHKLQTMLQVIFPML
jgi:isochorismate synthase